MAYNACFIICLQVHRKLRANSWTRIGGGGGVIGDIQGNELNICHKYCNMTIDSVPLPISTIQGTWWTSSLILKMWGMSGVELVGFEKHE